MVEHEERGWGSLQIFSLGIVSLFLVFSLFFVLSALAGAVWWIIKFVLLVGLLWLVIRWAFRKSNSSGHSGGRGPRG